MEEDADDAVWCSDEGAVAMAAAQPQQRARAAVGAATTITAPPAAADGVGVGAAPPAACCPRCAEPLGDEVLEVNGFIACAACGFVIDDSILVHTLFGPALDEGGDGGGRGGGGGGGEGGGRREQPVGVRVVWHDDPAGASALARELRRGAPAGVGRGASPASGREARRRRLHAQLRAVVAALPVAGALPRRAAGDGAADLLDRVDAAYRPPGLGEGGVADETVPSVRRAMRAETLAAVAYVTAREAGAPITFAGAAGAAACAPLAVAREFLRLKAALGLIVPQAPLSTLVLMQGATLLRIAGRGPPPAAAAAGGHRGGGSSTGPLSPLLPSPTALPLQQQHQQQQQQQRQQQQASLLPPPTRSAAGGLACSDRPSAVIAAASLAASNRDLVARERGAGAGARPLLAAAPLARRVAAHPAVASALRLAELMQALGVAETRRHDAVAAACLKLCIGATAPRRGHVPLRRLSVAEVVGAVGGASAKAVGGAVRAAQAELRRMVPLLPFPVRFSDAGAHADLLLRLHRLACKAQPPPPLPPTAEQPV